MSAAKKTAAPAKKTAAPAKKAAAPKTTRQLLGPERYERVRAMLGGIFFEQSFPQQGPEGVDDGSVDAVVHQLWSQHGKFGPELAKLGIGEPPPGWKRPAIRAPRADASEDFIATYMAHARHSRGAMPEGPLKPPTKTDAHSTFTGKLPMVRVRLPQRFVRGARTATPLGWVDWDDDHMLRSVEDVQTHFRGREKKDGWDFSCERVEIVTPPRDNNQRRFASTSIYFAYRKMADRTPTFFVLEAGHAGGAPRVLYPSRTMTEKLTSPAGYTPTPITDPTYWYHGQVKMKKDEPDWLHIKVSKTEHGTIFMETKIEFKREPLTHYDPKALYAEAALRILAIAGRRATSFDELKTMPKVQIDAGILLGKEVYDWEHKPRGA